MLLSLLFVFLHLVSFSQQRIGIDLSFRGTGLNANFTFQKVVFKNFLISGGFTIGNYGKNFINNYVTNNIGQLESGFVGRPNYLNDTTGILELQSYTSTNKAVGISIGIGAFKEFSVKHGIRFNLNTKFFYSTGNVNFSYGTSINGIHLTQKSNKFVASLSPELVHTIRLTGRMTFCYGVKVPYYFSLDKGKYNPKYRKDIFKGFEPELTIGLTRVIGKCD